MNSLDLAGRLSIHDRASAASTSSKGSLEEDRHLQLPTAKWALRKLRDFKAAERQDITITDPDGASLTEAELVGIVEGSGAAPCVVATPAAPQIKRQPAQA
ncbi:hypothetical protein [Methylobacterium sp. E-046]|uniref:hypothetical protein n=1 Tax=Methylobacterium sp. E-046 TaxID=2836576 RepID=UPI001FBC0714|nr:hypothetical protein [Methylobacterium sp. E-046]MCJ2099024.1 hypothetical protein [Methylobacterium sp. E-046]